jgi:hypothetical protein
MRPREEFGPDLTNDVLGEDFDFDLKYEGQCEALMKTWYYSRQCANRGRYTWRGHKVCGNHLKPGIHTV